MQDIILDKNNAETITFHSPSAEPCNWDNYSYVNAVNVHNRNNTDRLRTWISDSSHCHGEHPTFQFLIAQQSDHKVW